MFKKFMSQFVRTFLKNLPFPIILLAINFFGGNQNMFWLSILFLAWLLFFSLVVTIIEVRKQK